MADAQKSNSKDGFKRELPMTYNRTASINVHNEKVPFIWLAKKDNLMLLNLKKTSSINFNAQHVNGMTPTSWKIGEIKVRLLDTLEFFFRPSKISGSRKKLAPPDFPKRVIEKLDIYFPTTTVVDSHLSETLCLTGFPLLGFFACFPVPSLSLCFLDPYRFVLKLECY